MQWVETANEYLKNIKTYANTIDLYDIVEILIIAFLVYSILAWMKTTRSWRMLRGLVVICLFLLVVDLMEMTTIIWITRNVLGFAVTAIIVAMQPELRQALEAGGPAEASHGVREELGDLLFISAKIGQMSGVDPEEALHLACDKSDRRFRRVETAADKPLPAYTEEELVALWKSVKELS